MRTTITRTIAASLPLALAAAFASAAPTAAGPVFYEFTAGYSHGCFPPCLCPIIFTPGATGSFTLRPSPLVGLGDPTSFYQINNFRLSFPGSSDDVTGSGSYQIVSGITVTHRMELDLHTGTDGGSEHFDSGWLIGGFEFPDIDIAVSLHGMKCFDTVIDIQASPAKHQPGPADLDGDGHVNGVDLAILLGVWGRCPVCIIGPCPCLGDLDGNNQVNGLDLAVLLAAWG